MSAYVRQSLGLNRPSVTFGSSQRGRPSRNDRGDDAGQPPRRDRGGDNNGRGGGKNSLLAFRDQPPPPRRHHRHRNQRLLTADRFSREAIFGGMEEESDDDDDDEDVPIDGSIHAEQHESNEYSQVTLSQALSDGPTSSVRSFRSLSQPASATAGLQARSGGGGRHFGGMPRGGGASSRGGGNAHGRQQQQFSQSRHAGGRGRQERHAMMRRDDDEDDVSLRSSQPLLSQFSRPSSGNAGRPSSSGSRPNSSHSSSSGRPSSRGARQQQKQQLLASLSQPRSSRPTSRGRQLQDPRVRGPRQDDGSTARSQSLLSRLPSVPAPCRLESTLKRHSDARATSQRGHRGGRTLRDPSRSQQRSSQLAASSQLLRTPSRLLSVLTPPCAGRRSSVAGGTAAARAVRTVGAISGTLAALPYTPSRALRSVTSLAAKTTASLAGRLTPFRNRARPSSRLLESSSTRERAGGGDRGAAAPAPTEQANAPRGVLPDAERSHFARKDGNQGNGGASGGARGSVTPKEDGRMGPPLPRRGGSSNSPPSTPMVSKKTAAEQRPVTGGDSRSGSRDEDAVMKPPELRGDGNGGAGAEAEATKFSSFDQDPQEEHLPSTRGKSDEDLSSQENQAAAAGMPTLKQEVKSNTNVGNKRHRDDGDEGDDAGSKTTTSTLDVHGRAEEIILAVQRHRGELEKQQEDLNESKRDFQDTRDLAKRELKEEHARLEALRRTTAAEFAALRKSMDDFSERMASTSREHESSMRALAGRLTDEVRRECGRATESISERAREAAGQLPSEVRAVVEADARKLAEEVVGGMVAEVKIDFRAWVDGEVKRGIFEKSVPSEGAKRKRASDGSTAARVSVGSDGNLAEEDKARAEATVCALGNENEPTASHNNAGSLVPGQIEPPAENDNIIDGMSSISVLGSSSVGESSAEKENVEPGRIMSYPDKPAATRPGRNGLTGKDTGNVSSSIVSSPVTKKTSPLPRGSMSEPTTATPFSRRATPLQNNHARVRSGQSSGRSKHELELECELSNDFLVVKSPFSLAEKGSSVSTKTEARMVKKAPVKVPKHKVNASNTSVATETKRRNTKARIVGDAPRNATTSDRVASVDKRTNTKHNAQMQKNLGGNGRSKKRQRKRSMSAMMNVAKSPRRSKRLKEVNRAEQMAAVQIATAALAVVKEARRKPSKVTPNEDITPVVASARGDARDSASHSSIICHSISGAVAWKTGVDKTTANASSGYDALLGTSVTVPASDEREDELLGFDESDDAQPDRRSLSSLLPFGGFRKRKGKSMSRKKGKRKSTFDFSFY